MNKPLEHIEQAHQDFAPISIEIPLNTPMIDYVIRPFIANGFEFPIEAYNES